MGTCNSTLYVDQDSSWYKNLVAWCYKDLSGYHPIDQNIRARERLSEEMALWDAGEHDNHLLFPDRESRTAFLLKWC